MKTKDRFVAIAAVSGDPAAVDDVADLGDLVIGVTLEDRVELVLLGRCGVAGQFALEGLARGARGATSAEFITRGCP
jgi:hypothetical protein